MLEDFLITLDEILLLWPAGPSRGVQYCMPLQLAIIVIVIYPHAPWVCANAESHDQRCKFELVL